MLAEEGVWAGGGEWGTDGWIYAQGDGANIVRFSSDSGTRESVTALADGEVEHLWPDVLPSGRGVLFTVWRESPEFEGAAVAVHDVQSGTHRRIATGNRAIYSETGHLLVLGSDGSVLAAPFDEQRLELTGDLVPVLGSVTVGRWASFDFSLSRSGTLVYAGTGGRADGLRDLTWVDRAGNAVPLDANWRALFESVAVSPDQSRLVATVGVSAPTTLWVRRTDGGSPSQFTFSDGLNRRPSWSAMGDTILFISDRGGDRALWGKRADGVGDAHVILDLAAEVDEAGPEDANGWRVVRVGVSDGGERDVFAMRSEPDSMTVAIAVDPDVSEFSPTVSPDGRFVAYVSGDGEDARIWVKPFPRAEGGRWLVTQDQANEPRWSPDGRELFYRTPSYMVAARVQTDPSFAVLAVDTLFRTQRYYRHNLHPSYDVSSDGDRFLMIRRAAEDVSELVVVENFTEELKRMVPN